MYFFPTAWYLFKASIILERISLKETDSLLPSFFSLLVALVLSSLNSTYSLSNFFHEMKFLFPYVSRNSSINTTTVVVPEGKVGLDICAPFSLSVFCLL